MKLAEQRLEQQAMVDALTGFANRRGFDVRIEETMARSRRSNRPMGLTFLDVDFFNAINDTRGHHVGDQVLKELARRLIDAIRVTDRAFRLAGDEFVVLLEGLGGANEASHVAKKILQAVQRAMDLEDGAMLNITTSLGVATYFGRDSSAAELLERADRALYKAKAAGRGTFAETTG